VDQKDVEVELNEDTLMIKGEKSQEHEEKNKDYHRVERSYGSFRRILSLPEDADRDAINATFQNGVMNIKIPRKALPESKSRQIEVKAA
jgi:HSP20 family protein